MRVGPINATVGAAQSPLKALAVQVAVKTRHPVLFDGSHPHSLSSDVLAYDLDVPCRGTTPDGSRAIVAQLIELGQNTEWHNCGIYITNREDGVSDAQDGWYVIENVRADELSQTMGWLNATVTVAQRARRAAAVGVWWDAKLQPNDYGLSSGTSLVAYPMGLDLTIEYPATTYQLTGQNGTIGLVENPGVNLRSPLVDPIIQQTQGRCSATDENSAGTTSTEIYWRDHRTLNGYTRIDNDLVRYTLHPGDTACTVEVWNSGWVAVGNYALQAWSGSAYTALPLQSYALQVVTPEEVVWEERRYDAGSVSFVRLLNRIRRGSRIVESQIITASGLGLAGPQSVGFTGMSGTWTQANSADTTGVVWTQAANLVVPGFGFLTKPPVAATVVTGDLWSGLSVPAGTIGRIGIVAGLQDACYTAAGTAALYAAKQASYNRMRVKQTLLLRG